VTGFVSYFVIVYLLQVKQIIKYNIKSICCMCLCWYMACLWI